MAREASPYATKRLIELMDDPDSRVALMAADEVLERAWGKPKEQDEQTTEEARLAGLTDAQRLAEAVDVIARAREALALSGPTIEGEASEVEEKISIIKG
jgi:hypothetical protein